MGLSFSVMCENPVPRFHCQVHCRLAWTCAVTHNPLGEKPALAWLSPRSCLCTGTTATLIFCNVISHSNPFFPFGAMAADIETSHLEKERKKTPKRENLHLFTSPPTLSWIPQMLGDFVIVLKKLLPFYLFSSLLLVFFLITFWEMKTDTLKKSCNLWHFQAMLSHFIG